MAREPTARPQPFSRYEILINTFGCPLYLQKRGTRHKQHQNDGTIHTHFDLAELQRQHHHLTMIVNKGTTQTSAKARSSYITHIHVAKYYTVYIYIYIYIPHICIYICTIYMYLYIPVPYIYNVGYWLVWGYWIVSTDLKIILKLWKWSRVQFCVHRILV